MGNSNESELSTLQRYICNILAGAAIIICGVFLLLVGIGGIPLKLADIALPSVLLTFGLIFVATAAVQRNSVSLWFSFFFNIPAVIILLVVYAESPTYSNMYPFFISIPAFASLFTLILSREYHAHLFTVTFFGVLTVLFCLQSFGVAGWGAVIPSIVIFSGAIILFSALFARKIKE